MSFDINKKEGGGVTCEDMQGSNALAVPMARDGETKGTSCPATSPATAATGAQHSLHPSRNGRTNKGNCFVFLIITRNGTRNVRRYFTEQFKAQPCSQS